jgi:predicted lipoprotein with Yx(FWY)xxD motif
MKTSTVVAVIVALVVVAGGWYWWSQNNMAPATPTTQQVTTSTVPETFALRTNTSADLGTYLVDTNGMTLYMYTKDTPGVSNCSGQCAANWPPYVVASADAATHVQAGVAGKVGTITRADGSLQVTYNDEPLYYWVKDTKPGDTTGQNVGGVWFVVKP